MLVIGGAHSQASLCVCVGGGGHCKSGLLPVFFFSRSHVLSCGFVLPPIQCCGWWYENAQLFHAFFCSLFPSYSLFVLGHTFQSSLGLSNVYIYVNLVAVPARNLVCHFLLLHFRGLLFHSHKQLFQGVLA